MQATVIETFHGVDFSVVYEAGKAYDFDEERLASLVQRGLVTPIETEVKNSLGETTSEETVEETTSEENKRTRSRKR